MISQLKQVRVQLEQDLERIFIDECNVLFAAKKSLVIIRACCRNLSVIRLQCDFKTREEEIYFFKELKCFYYSQLYYYQDIIEIECGMPNGSKESKQNFLKEYLHKLNNHFSNNRFFYTYYRAGGTDKDHLYFSLIPRHETKLDDQAKDMFCEDDYSCGYDLLYARVISNDRLEKYLHKEINASKGMEKLYGTTISSKSRSKLEWTESKAALVELLYALHESRCINDGKAEMKELVRMVEFFFQGLELGDFYRTYMDLRIRAERTKFINTLKKYLEQRMNKDDEKENPGLNLLENK